jgi:hypothetical protein
MADQQLFFSFRPAGFVVAVGQLLFPHLERRKHREDDRHVFRSGALTALLLAAVEQ